MKVVEGLKPWEVMKRASEGEPVATSHLPVPMPKQVWRVVEFPVWNWGKCDYAIIDTTAPELDWSKFNYDFFNQYGGLPVTRSGFKSAIPKVPPFTEHDRYKLRESPFYYWPGGECPVPGNVEVDYIFRDGKNSNTSSAGNMRWTHIHSSRDIIAFRLTGKVL